MPAERRLLILGSTGSIGRQTLEVVAHLNALAGQGLHPTRYRVVGLAAATSSRALAQQAAAYRVSRTALCVPGPEDMPLPGCHTGPGSALALTERCLAEDRPDLVMAAVVGSAGLPATLAAVRAGVDVALANKETLVAAGALVTAAARASGARLLPVDSEHAALWQALQRSPRDGESSPSLVVPPCDPPPAVRRVILTASGGAFRDATPEQLAIATPEQALRHPTWQMGPKVTIDSATLVNKALELIEARWLFGLSPDQLSAVVHRQSIVHSLVEYADGNILAQLGASDMRIPIQHALTFPHRALSSPAAPLDLAALSRLTFEEPDHDRFPALRLAHRVLTLGGTAGAVFNAANEAAVELFLQHRVSFPDIARLASSALDALTPSEAARPADSLHAVQAADGAARAFVAERAAHLPTPSVTLR